MQIEKTNNPIVTITLTHDEARALFTVAAKSAYNLDSEFFGDSSDAPRIMNDLYVELSPLGLEIYPTKSVAIRASKLS